MNREPSREVREEIDTKAVMTKKGRGKETQNRRVQDEESQKRVSVCPSFTRAKYLLSYKGVRAERA